MHHTTNRPHEPAVSILMPLFNKEPEVKRAIESVLTQTVSDFELIVVNDGSVDNGPEIVRNINDPRIRLFDQENAGVSAARNRGIKEAKSDLIAFLDADDEWKPTFLETIFSLKNKLPTCKVFATSYIYREVNGTHRLPVIKGIPSPPWEGILKNYFDVAIKSDPPLWTSAVAVNKEAINEVGLFPVGIHSGEDLLTWAKLALRYDIAYSTTPESVFFLRTPSASLPTRIPDKDDRVGKALESFLLDLSSTQKSAFKNYIGLWYRMRASMYLRLGMRKEAFREVQKMRGYADKNVPFYLYTMMAYLPSSISKVLIKCLNLIKALRRFFSNRLIDPTFDNSEKPNIQFYEGIDREKAYTIENNLNLHPFYRLLSDFIGKWDLKYKKCLEIGSSKGLFQDFIEGYVGLDISKNLSKYYHKNFVVASGDHLPFPNESFDGIFTCATHEHIPELEKALNEIIRVLKPGGICLFAPAWHTRPWFSQGYQVRPYIDLTNKQKLIKFSIPFRNFCIIRWPVIFYRRLIRLCEHFFNRKQPKALKYKKLKPNYDVYWQSDSDACNSIDPFDVILWFKSRGFICHGYENWFKILLVRTYALELQKKD